MTKKELIERMVSSTNLTRSQATAAVDSMLRSMEESLKNHDSIEFRDLFTISVKRAAGRTCHNFKTGEAILISPRYDAKIKLSNRLKHELNK